MVNLKKAREKKGYTQAEFAKMLNVSRVTVARYESGDRWPDQTTLKKMAELLECSTDTLLGIEKEEKVSAQTIYDILQRLPDEKLDQVLEYARFLTENTNKKQENGHGA